MICKDTHFHIVDDWNSFEATPSYDHDNLVAVGLYTSDFLSDGELPVAMDNAATLADFLDHEGETLSKATVELWKMMAGWSRDQMVDAGAMSYFGVGKDIFHLAGIYDPDDWYTIDERAQRFKPLLNDEYGRDFLAELLGYVSLPSQQGSPYTMSKWTGAPGDMWWTVPYSVLTDDEFTSTSGPMAPGSTGLPAKTGPYLTTRGKLSLEQYNAACADFTPTICQKPYRFLDDAWVRGHADSPLADELYKIDQRNSVTLAGRGAGLTAADIAHIRAKRAGGSGPTGAADTAATAATAAATE